MSVSSGLLQRPGPPRSAGGDTPPPDVVEDGGGGESGWTRLVRTANEIEAHLLMGCLGEAGVESRLLKDRGSPGGWLHGGSNPWAEVSVMVRGRQLEDARIVLAEVALHAPARGVARRTGWRVPVVWWATALLLGLLTSGFVLAQVVLADTPCQMPFFCQRLEEQGGSTRD